MIDYFKHISKKRIYVKFNTCKIIKSIETQFLYAYCFIGNILLILQVDVYRIAVPVTLPIRPSV